MGAAGTAGIVNSWNSLSGILRKLMLYLPTSFFFFNCYKAFPLLFCLRGREMEGTGKVGERKRMLSSTGLLPRLSAMVGTKARNYKCNPVLPYGWREYHRWKPSLLPHWVFIGRKQDLRFRDGNQIQTFQCVTLSVFLIDVSTCSDAVYSLCIFWSSKSEGKPWPLAVYLLEESVFVFILVFYLIPYVVYIEGLPYAKQPAKCQPQKIGTLSRLGVQV